MAEITEIAPDVYRICFYLPQIDLQFSQFLIKDDEPVLFHTLMRGMFPQTREALARLISPEKLRWISFSHFEADECGALNEWLAIAPHAQAICSPLAALVNVNDFASRPARQLTPADSLATGRFCFRYINTPQLPHGWDAGVLFEETTKTLFCSDILHQQGQCDPLTSSDVLERVRRTLKEYHASELLAGYQPYTPQTGRTLERLAQLVPERLATQHGSVYEGNGAAVLRDLAVVMREVLGDESSATAARSTSGL
jgi:flavorubredoxin